MAERVLSSASASIASHCAQCCGLPGPPRFPGFPLPNWLKSATFTTSLSIDVLPGSVSLFCLTFYTLQKSCKFPPAAADAAFHRSFGDPENLRYFFVIHIFQIAKYNCFAEFGGELFKRVLDADFELEAGDVLFLGLAGVGEPVGHRGAVVLAVEGGIEGFAGAIEPEIQPSS